MSAQSAQVLELRRTLERRFPDAVPVPYRTTGAVPTGLEALDAVLPGGGLPRGRVTVWAPGGGATALLRAACGVVVERGERAAWVDGAGVVSGDHWRSGAVLLRPEGRYEALSCAEELARSGGFALVVLAGVDAVGSRAGAGRRSGGDGRGVGPALSDAEGVRCTRAAREGGAALVLLGGRVAGAALRLASWIPPDGYRWRRGPLDEPAEVGAVKASVRVRGMGWNREAEVLFSVAHHDVRLSADPGLVDRRGVRV